MAEKMYTKENEREAKLKKDRAWRWTQVEMVLIALFLLFAAFAMLTLGVWQKIG